MYHQISVKAVNQIKKACRSLKKDLLIIEVPKDYNPHYTYEINEYELNGNLDSDLKFVAGEDKDYYIYECDKNKFGNLYSLSCNPS